MIKTTTRVNDKKTSMAAYDYPGHIFFTSAPALDYNKIGIIPTIITIVVVSTPKNRTV